MSAIFISHSSQDNAWAERIRDWLQDSANKQQPAYCYQSLFLDFDPEQGIPVGRSWRETLYEKLQLCRAVIVICSATYGKSQWCLAELGVAMASGKLVLPVRIDDSPSLRLLNETQRTPLVPIDLVPTGLEGWQQLERGLRALSWQERLAWPPENEPHASPFPGLSCFERKHAPVFFGQDQPLRQAQAKVEALTASASRLLLILGASGCGKSSLLRAGLVPWLAGAEPGRWIVLDPFRPGRKPFRWLDVALEKAFRAMGQTPPSEQARTATKILERLEELRAHTGQQDGKVVIPIDQFEEILGRGDEREDAKPTEADDFLSTLAELLKLEGSRVLILATLRSDFLGSLQLHPSRLEGLAGDPILLGPMDVDGFRQVIEGPAQRVGVRLETGLSDRLVRDTPTGDALPLLAFTLRELWDGRADGAGLTLKQYDDIGGLAGAVRRKADEVLATSGATDEEIEALERAFIDHLVRLTSDGQAAKQPARLETLSAASRRLVGLFVEARLLVTGKGSDGDAVEIAHEALLRTWPKLVGWIDKGREALLQRLRVRRLGEDLNATAPERQRRQALEQLAALAASGGVEAQAVEREGAQPLADLLAAADAPEADRLDAALVLALIGQEKPLRQCLGDAAAPVALRRRAAESLGLLAKRSGDRDQRDRIVAKLKGWLLSDALDLLVAGEEGWAEHDRRLPPLQGASRGLQLAASAELPLLGSGPGRVVPMLTLTALEEGGGLHITTEVVEVPVWRLPLPGGEQLELVAIPGGEHTIGSPADERDKAAVLNWFAGNRDGCRDPRTGEPLDVEAERRVELAPFWLLRHPISQRQWQAVVKAVEAVERELDESPGGAKAESLWDLYGQPGELAVNQVSWNDSQEWLRRLNRWLSEQWLVLGGTGEPLQLALPGEGQWEAACRARTATPLHFGDTLDFRWARYDASYVFGLGRKGAKAKQPGVNGGCGLVNRYGLAEMHGQLYEWCGDSWHPNPVGEGWRADGLPWEGEDGDLAQRESGQRGWKLLRGGSWIYDPHFCRAANRNGGNPGYDDPLIGLRPCCCPSPPGSLLGS
jgi:formylglycine-generating enzyme required for sulfatase activity